MQNKKQNKKPNIKYENNQTKNVEFKTPAH